MTMRRGGARFSSTVAVAGGLVAALCSLGAACAGRPGGPRTGPEAGGPDAGSGAAQGAEARGGPDPGPAATGARAPIALTYLGVAGWQLDAGERTILADPYFSRPDLGGLVAPDAAAIARRAPKRADLIVVGHSHVDHLLDAPSVALATGAQLLGSVSTAHVARASGVPADRVITVKGGEDFEMGGYSVRVIPSLHSALDGKHVFGGALAASPKLPMRFADYEEGGTFIYLVRIAGHQVLITSTANFIERELEGLRPDVAIVAPGLRQEIHDYTCRLLRVLGYPPLVYTTHFDDWRGPPADAPPSDDLRAFVDEVHRCAPRTRVVIPKHFDRMIVP
jgi:L-ascorbate metabolism protein UlaG (beta-lactamase superfamily)